MNHQRRGGPRNDFDSGPYEHVQKAIEQLSSFSELDAKDLNDYADQLGDALYKGEFTTSKLRKFLDGVNKNWADARKRKPSEFTRDGAIYLKPQLAYAVGRENNDRALKSLASVLFAAIDRVGNSEKGYHDYKCFVDFFQAIVAYHKFYGGRDS